jgi:hypothetical protein
MVLFELMGSASHPLFRHISKTYWWVNNPDDWPR